MTRHDELPRYMKYLMTVGAIVGVAVAFMLMGEDTSDSWLDRLTIIVPFAGGSALIVGFSYGLIANLLDAIKRKSLLRAIVAIITVVGLFMAALGLFSTVLGSLTAEGFHPGVQSSSELPLGRLGGITGDAAGNLFCGLQSYNRVQVYDDSGQFQRGWFIQSYGGEFRIRTNGDDHIEVACTRGRKIFTYNAEGETISEADDDKYGSIFDEFSDTSQRKYHDVDGNSYSIRNGFVFSDVLKTDPAGVQSVIIASRSFKWYLMGRFPSWIMGMLGLVVVFIGAALHSAITRSDPPSGIPAWHPAPKMDR